LLWVGFSLVVFWDQVGGDVSTAGDGWFVHCAVYHWCDGARHSSPGDEGGVSWVGGARSRSAVAGKISAILVKPMDARGQCRLRITQDIGLRAWGG